MKFREFVVRYSRGTKFPDCPANRGLVDVIKRVYGTTSPAILAVKLSQKARKDKKR